MRCHPFKIGFNGSFVVPTINRNFTNRQWNNVCGRDDAYRFQLEKFHPEMKLYVALARDASYWDHCWSTVWVYAFLVQFIRSPSDVLKKNMKNVGIPMYAIIDVCKKRFEPKQNDQLQVKDYHTKHCEHLSRDTTNCSAPDKWPNFIQKVNAARNVVCRLLECNAAFLSEDVVLLMRPYLSKLSRDELRGKHFASWLSDEMILEVIKAKTIDEINRIHGRQTNLLKPCASLTTKITTVGGKNPKRRPLSTSTNIDSISSTAEQVKKKVRCRGKTRGRANLRHQHRAEASVPCTRTTSNDTSENAIDRFNINQANTENDTNDANLLFKYDELEDDRRKVSVPTIVVETFRHKATNALAKGPNGTHGDASCFSDDRNDRLSMVISCPTMGAYIYCFSMAHKRHHFVISEREIHPYISKAVNANSGMPKLLLHSRDCLSSPIKIDNDDGSLNFHLCLDRTDEFRKAFGSFDTDFQWWMKKFDELSVGGEAHSRGSSETIDLGWARHGSSESTINSQNRSAKIVCALPHVIHKCKINEFKQISGLLDQMTDFMDINFLDDGHKLFGDQRRENQFASILREMSDGMKFRAEAFTVVRQSLGTVSAFRKGESKCELTKRHV